jgi:hypothetical protein
MEQMQRIDRFKPFVFYCVHEIGWNTQYCSNIVHSIVVKLLWQIYGTVILARSESSNLDRTTERWPNSRHFSYSHKFKWSKSINGNSGANWACCRVARWSNMGPICTVLVRELVFFSYVITAVVGSIKIQTDPWIPLN